MSARERQQPRRWNRAPHNRSPLPYPPPYGTLFSHFIDDDDDESDTSWEGGSSSDDNRNGDRSDGEGVAASVESSSSSSSNDEQVVGRRAARRMAGVRQSEESTARPGLAASQSVSPLQLYFSFWNVRGDAISQLRDVITRIPYRRFNTRNSEHSHEMLSIAAATSMDDTERVEGVPRGRLQLIQTVDSILGVSVSEATRLSRCVCQSVRFIVELCDA